MNTLWLNNTIHFGLRGIDEHRKLDWGDVSIKKDEQGSEYLEFNERDTKTRTGDDVRRCEKYSASQTKNVAKQS